MAQQLSNLYLHQDWTGLQSKWGAGRRTGVQSRATEEKLGIGINMVGMGWQGRGKERKRKQLRGNIWIYKGRYWRCLISYQIGSKETEEPTQDPSCRHSFSSSWVC